MKKVKLLQLIVLIFISGLIGYYFGINNVKVPGKTTTILTVVNKEAPAGLSLVDFSYTFWKCLGQS